MEKARSKYRILSLIMTVLILIMSLPISAFASAISTDSNDISTSVDAESETVEKDVVVLEEDETLRDENTKHFKLSDGTTKAVVYSQAVHYKDADGNWVDIDNALTLNGSEYSSNNKSEIKFANKSGSTGLVSIKDGDYKIDFTPLNTNKVSVVIENPQSNNSRKFEDMSVLNNLVSKAIYADIYDGIDIEYILVGNNIKENIIVKEKQDSYTFSFELKLNKLSAELKDGAIILSDYDSGEEVYEIPVPYMFDANNVYSESVEYSLVQNNKWKYTFTVTADAEWINADDRAFPVTIDPTISSNESNIIEDTSISSEDPDYVEAGELAVICAGERMTAYWKINTLPQIPDYAYITEATFSANVHSATRWASATLNLYEVTSDWDENTLCYNLFQEGYGKLSSQACSNKYDENGDQIGLFDWDVTKLVNKWINNPSVNYGLAFTEDESGTAINSYRFHSSESLSSSLAPNLCITYININGLEEYWSYTMQNAGMAGNGYINNTTGTLYFSIGTLTTTDSLFSFTPCLIYNQEFAGVSATSNVATVPYTQEMFGYGFKLNMNETIVADWYDNGDSGETKYYIWSDTDGTNHDFYPQTLNGTTVYKDNDGLFLTLQEDDQYYTITDLDKNVRKFTKKNETSLSNINDGAILSSISDNNNNKLEFDFDSYGRIEAVKVTPNGSSPITYLQFYYNDLGVLKEIANADAGQRVLFEYSSEYNGDVSSDNKGFLRRITHLYTKDGSTTRAVAAYEYNSTGKLISAYDNFTKYKIEYSYVGRTVVGAIEKSGSALQAGQIVGLTYDVNYTEVRNSGKDDVFGNSDDIITIYTHDNKGRAVSSYTTDRTKTTIYGAISGSYEDTDEIKNNVKSSAVVGGTASNYIYNGGFEKGLIGWNKTSNVVISNSSNANGGHKSVYFNVQPNITDAISQYVSLSEGTYTISLQVDTANAINIKLQLVVQSLTDSTKRIVEEIPVNENSASGTVSIASTTFDAATNGESFSISIKAIAGELDSSKAASISIDNVMLEKNIGHSGYSIVEFGNFENYSIDSSGNTLYSYDSDWVLETTNDDLYSIPSIESTGSLFGNSVKIRDGKAYQVVYEASEDELVDYSKMGRTFVLSAFAKGTYQIGNKDSNFKISIIVEDEAGEEEIIDMNFNRNCESWQFATTSFSIPSTVSISKITLSCEYTGHLGVAYFDNIYLTQSIDESVVTNEYYDNGLIRAKKSGYFEEYYEYDSSKRLARKANNNGEIYSYTYNSSGDILTETYYTFTYNGGTSYPYKNSDPDSLITKTAKRKTVYAYNQYGQQTSSDMYEMGVTDATHIKTTNEYITDSGSKIFGALKSGTDNLGRKTIYFYDETKGYMLAAIKADGTGMCYEYNAIGDIIKVMPATYAVTEDTYSAVTSRVIIEYTYNSQQLLSTIKTNSTKYAFNYNVFGQNESVYIGEDKILSCEYNSYNGKLVKINYENNFSVRYVYNEIDNIKEIWYTNNGIETKAYEYSYTSSGLLYRFDNLLENTAVVYQYDLENRMVSFIEFDTEADVNEFSIRCIYNDQGLVSGSFINGVYNANETETDDYEIELSYEYYANDLLKSYIVTANEQHIVVESLSYDVYERMAGRNTEYCSKSIIKERFTYLSNGSDTSALVSQHSVFVSISGVTKIYTYEYDDNGNITTKTDSTGKTYKYMYNDLGQLIKEDDVYNGLSYLYAYDYTGNIRAKRTYPLFEIEDGIPTEYYSNTAFAYSNSQWGDQLTGVNGTSITYDAVGNPLSYYNGFKFTWKNGNELASATNDRYSITYTYDDTGSRTSKTVNGVKHTYRLNGSQIMSEEWGVHLFTYLYDSQGSPLGILYRNHSYVEDSFQLFYFEKNLQGDIVAVYSEYGKKVAWYEYDAWGNQIDSGCIGSEGTVYHLIYEYNPFRYRGYYFDVETNLYYLNSRYYDSNICRFISPDTTGTLTASPLGLSDKNLYAYCDNNPVTRTDNGGMFWDVVFDAVSLCVSVVDVVLNPDDPWAWVGLAADVVSLVVPFATGGGMIVKAVSKVDDAVDLVKAATKVDDVVDAVRATDKALDAVDTASDIGKATSKLDDAADLVGNMKKNVCSNGACFAAGTPIETEYGSVQIEDIKVGTLVYAHNPDTGETELKKVIDAFVKKTYQLIHIEVNGEKITTTPEHPFWVPQKGWTNAVSLRAGDRLQLLNGEYVVIEQVQHEILENPITVYNFEVEDFHTYYITSSEILVHNADCGMNNLQAKEAAEKLGYSKVKGVTSNGKSVFVNYNAPKRMRYISADADMHNGGIWKAASSIKKLSSKATRTGTFDALLRWIKP